MTNESKQDRFDFEEEKFWLDVGDYLLHGIPSHDKRGHSAEIRFRVRPLQLDIIGNIKEKMPEGWYKNRASLVRNILAVGCKATLEYLKRHEDVAKADNFDKINQLLKDMNRIAKYDRLDEFKRDIFTLQQNILQGDQKNKAEIISLLDKLKEEVIKEQGSV
jgi:hypothetical protein